jgi:hypothetical protein
MEGFMSDETIKSVSGQVTLPGMEGEMGYEAIILKPWEERFCLEYVQKASNGKQAYLAVKPKVTEKTAEVESSKLLRNPKIAARVKEIQEDFYRRLAGKVANYHDSVLSVDRRVFLDDDGRCKRLDELPEEAVAILEFEQVSSKDGVRTLLKVPTRHQSAVEAAKIAGMTKDKLELTGANGGPVEHSIPALMAEIMGTTRNLVQEPAGD